VPAQLPSANTRACVRTSAGDDLLRDALRDVQAVKRRRGADVIGAICLAYEDEQGNVTTIAEGEELASLSERVAAAGDAPDALSAAGVAVRLLAVSRQSQPNSVR
jgi:hypothetical protein